MLLVQREFEVTLSSLAGAANPPRFRVRAATVRERMEFDAALAKMVECTDTADVVALLFPGLSARVLSPPPGTLLDALEETQLVELAITIQGFERLTAAQKKSSSSPSHSQKGNSAATALEAANVAGQTESSSNAPNATGAAAPNAANAAIGN